MFKRVTIVTLVVAAFVLLMAVPAFAFNGYRGDYTIKEGCACHNNAIGSLPPITPSWSGSKHAVAGADNQATRLPYGSVCQGCHTSNFDPAKVIPTPTATAANGTVSWGAANGIPDPLTQSTGNFASSENFVGCSSCHYGTNALGPLFGEDANDTTHNVPFGNMADAQICGACHSRYSYTKNTYAVQPIPAPVQTTLIQPQMAIGYPMLGSPSPAPAWSPNLADYLVVPQPGWTPLPDPAATSAGLGRLQTYWQIDGQDSLWQQTGHDGSAAQYPEWKSEGHAAALDALKAIGQGNNPQCLECHSADYRIMKESGKSVAGYTAKYGVTCVGCHAPHDAGTTSGTWDEDFDAQLNNDASLKGKTNVERASNLCVECHNGEIPEGTTAAPGTEIHHPMKEMLDGYGAIDVSAFPSVHKGKCVACHMPPTSLSRGAVQLGGNHTFNIITPADANDATPIPYVTQTAVATATPTPGGTPVITTTLTVWQDGMPFSACSTCHNNQKPEYEGPEPVTRVTATPTPTASPLRVNVTVTQDANGNAIPGSTPGGDKAMWLQDTLDQRQTWTKAKVAEIWAALDTAAANLGYASRAAAHTALVAKPANTWTTAERAFLSGWTNNEFVESEGSFGLHNWDYSREIVNKAMQQALTAQTGVVVKLPWVVTLSLSKSTMAVNTKVKFSGHVATAKGVNGAGTVKITKLVSGVWKVWKSATLNASGNYSLTVKMTKKGTFHFRALMPTDSLNTKASSPKRKLVVK